MWEAHSEPVPSGLKLRLVENGAPLSFRDFFERLRDDAKFVSWYSNTLVDCSFEGFFWELPPLTADKLERDAELVLIESAALANLRPDPSAFHTHFAAAQGSEVVTFPNLGGDALLVVPTPIVAPAVYPHLATFLHGAPQSQVLSLWRTTARIVGENLSDSPRWLSTAGLGVSWLHLRLDTRPKYYRHQPYKSPHG